MKKVMFSLVVLLNTFTSLSQAQVKTNEGIPTLKKQNHEAAIYQLFPTQNMWTFIKLDTRNGQMWQVQYDVKNNNRFVTYLNSTPLAAKEEEVNDRFTLYPTQNMYNFILLDQLDGRTWQVQWSIEPGNRGIILIE
jgi:hypothetical protein